MSASDLAKAGSEQRLAADPRRSVWVSANAGSGKTKVLTDRIARLLLAGSPPSRILAVTYTKAAAAEMKTRLFQTLGNWAIANDAALTHALNELEGNEPTTPVSTQQLARARRLFARALDTPGGLKILTIHAFCQIILQRFPLEAGLAPGFSVLEEFEANVLAMASREQLLLGDAKTIAAFELMAGEVADDAFDKLLRETLNRRAEREAILEDGLEDAIGRLADAVGLEQLVTPEELKQAAVDKLAAKAGAAIEVLQATNGSTGPDMAAALKAALAMQDMDACFDACCKQFFTATGTVSKHRFNAPTKANPAVQAVFEIADFPGSGEVSDAFVYAVDQLKALATVERSAAVLQVSLAYAQAYAAQKTARGALDFSDLLDRTRNLLTGASGQAAWVLFKLDQGLEHILIDEAQDTSPDQWALLKPLFDELDAGQGASERPRTRFVVGDEKQSIFGFQGADPEKFLHERDRFQASARDDHPTITLSMSWRTTQTVLDAVDDVWRQRLPDPPLEQKFLDTSQRHIAQRSADPGRVELWPLNRPNPKDNSANAWLAPLDQQAESSPRQTLARAIAAEVARWLDPAKPSAVFDKDTKALRPANAGDIMILVRTRNALFLNIIRALKANKVSVAGADRIVLADDLAVMDLMALGHAALLPDDDLTVATVLRGPFVGLLDDDNDLYTIAHARGRQSVWDALMARREPRFQPAQDLLRSVRSRVGALPPYEFFAAVLERPFEDAETGWEKLIGRLGSEAREPVEAFLTKALAHGRQRAPSLQRFLEEIAGNGGSVKREQEDGKAAVRVMTVHGAKGLEAPIVIMPDTTNVPQTSDQTLFFDPDHRVWAWSAKKDQDTKRVSVLRDKANARTDAEQSRLLYVAMTRARDKLVVCGAWSGQNKPKSTGFEAKSWYPRVQKALEAGVDFDSPLGPGKALGPDLAPIAATGTSATGSDDVPAWARTLPPLESPAPRRAAPSSLYADTPEPKAISPGKADTNRFRRGSLIHELLQRLPDLPSDQRLAAATARLARERDLNEEQRADIVGEALKVLGDPAFAALFGPGSRAEVSIAGRVFDLDVVGSIDRLIVDHREVFILDYKTNKPPPVLEHDVAPLYQRQMALYRTVLAEIYPDRRVRCALLWTDEPRLMELSAALLDAALRDIPGVPKSG